MHKHYISYTKENILHPWGNLDIVCLFRTERNWKT